MKTVLVSWSGGKDSCLALHELLQSGEYEVAALLTTVACDIERVQMHGVRSVLLERQAECLGLPLRQVHVRAGATNEEYERALAGALSEYLDRGIDSVVFGDLFLEDVRAYREQFLARRGMRGLYPVWGRGTVEFVREFVALGFKAVVTCVNSEVLDGSFAGRTIDEEFLRSLPPGVDPCGENGEFHTFVFDGPSFTEEVRFSVGEKVLRDSFWFCDLLPGRP